MGLVSLSRTKGWRFAFAEKHLQRGHGGPSRKSCGVGERDHSMDQSRGLASLCFLLSNFVNITWLKSQTHEGFGPRGLGMLFWVRFDKPRCIVTDLCRMSASWEFSERFFGTLYTESGVEVFGGPNHDFVPTLSPV